MKKQWIWWLSGILVLILLFAWSKSFSANSKPVLTIADPTTLPGMQVGDAPWVPEVSNLFTRLKDIGLPALPQEGTAMHIHQHLDIFIHGNAVPVPAGIGINAAAGFIAPLHTHDGTGIIHVESPTVQTFTLGQFFDIWGVKFTAQCIGGYCTDATSTLKVYVNGTLYQGDPRQLALAEHQEIAVVYGTAQEQLSSLPTFIFPAGY